MAEEQTPQGVQDPVQPAAPAPAAPEQQQYSSTAPWGSDLSQFGDQAGAVDQYLRERWQPRVTQLEQRYAETEGARQLLDAFNTDPDAANVALQRQLYGDTYADQLAASINRPDLLVGQQAPQQQAPQQQAPQQQEADWRSDPVYQQMAERMQQEQYDAAKADFLSTRGVDGQPLYADIDPDLLDPFVSGAETWEDAVNSYRAYAARFSSNTPDPAPPEAPTVLGSDTVGTAGSTPTYPQHESLNDAIDAIFGENRPIAPTTIGQ